MQWLEVPVAVLDPDEQLGALLLDPRRTTGGWLAVVLTLEDSRSILFVGVQKPRETRLYKDGSYNVFVACIAYFGISLLVKTKCFLPLFSIYLCTPDLSLMSAVNSQLLPPFFVEP
jgi:hypothetical protein